jgi:regulator of sigma E protease
MGSEGSGAMPQVAYTVLALLGFGFIVFIHELGHFLAAKLFKVKVKAFSLGFPPTVLHKQVGETDYRLGMIPFGGYVSMIGEDSKEAKSDDPRALSNIAPWKRAIVFLAGVGMNVLSAVVIYIIASGIGIEVDSPIVGGLEHPSPARSAGLQPGNRIISIDGEQIDRFRDISFWLAIGGLNDPDHRFEIGIEGRDEPLTLAATRTSGSPIPKIGVYTPQRPVLGKVRKGSPAHQAGLREGDRIVSVLGQKVTYLAGVLHLLRRMPTEPFTITVERTAGKADVETTEAKIEHVTLNIDMATITTPQYGLAPLLRVVVVVKDSAAEAAGFKPGDFLVSVGQVKYPNSNDLTDAIQNSKGKPFDVVVWRGDQREELTVSPKLNELLGYYQMGIAYGLGEDVLLRRLGKPSAAIAAGIPDGSTLVSINDTKVKDWNKVNKLLEEADGKPVKVGYRQAESEEVKTVTVEPLADKPESVLIGIPILESPVVTELLPKMNFASGLEYGLRQIRKITLLQYVSIVGLLSRNVETKQLMGPVRIGVGFYQQAEKGWGTFFSFLALISVAIALLNVMPILPLDGGLVLFLVIEAVIRRPVPEKIRNVFIVIGLVGLLSLVALAFFNDGMWVFQQIGF